MLSDQKSANIFAHFSGPGGISRGIDTGNLHEIAVRTLWDHSRGLKATDLNPNQLNSGPQGSTQLPPKKVKLFCFVSMSILVIDESADDQGHITV